VTVPSGINVTASLCGTATFSGEVVTEICLVSLLIASTLLMARRGRFVWDEPFIFPICQATLFFTFEIKDTLF